MLLKYEFLISSLLITISSQTVVKVDTRIVGGTHSTRGEFPFMVALLYNGRFICSGSIISEEWVLTAAHCVFNKITSVFKVISGTIEMDTLTGEKTSVSQVICHENYSHANFLANDIALLRLSVALNLNDDVWPVILPDYKEDIPDFAETHIMGWGYDQYNSNPSNILKKATVYVIPMETCKIPYSYHSVPIRSTNVCGGTPNGGIGQCSGDSGGPMVYSVNSKQIGIVSFSAKPCGSKYFPQILTRVPEYRNWIYEKSGV